MYGDRHQALHDVDVLLDKPSAQGVGHLLAPTGNLQELSLACGWGGEFMQLAAELDKMMGLD